MSLPPWDFFLPIFKDCLPKVLEFTKSAYSKRYGTPRTYVKGKLPVGLEPYYGYLGQETMYFGREIYYDDLLKPLEPTFHWKNPQERIVVLTGESGTGKSSLLHMVLLKQIQRFGWSYKFVEDYATSFSSYSPFKLSANCKDLNGKLCSCRVLVFDQFERFVLDTRPEDRDAFVQEFKALMSDPDNPVITYTVIRKDYIATLYEPFFRHFQSQYTQITLLPFSIEDTHYVLEKILLSKTDFSMLDEADTASEKDAIKALAHHVADDLHLGREYVLPVEVQIILIQIQRYKLFRIDRYIRQGRKSGLLFAYLTDVLKDLSESLHFSIDHTTLLMLMRCFVEADLRSIKAKSRTVQDIVQILHSQGAKINPEHIQAALKALSASERRILADKHKKNETETRYELQHDYLAERILDACMGDKRIKHAERAEETLNRLSLIVQTGRKPDVTIQEARELLLLGQHLHHRPDYHLLRRAALYKLLLIWGMLPATLILLLAFSYFGFQTIERDDSPTGSQLIITQGAKWLPIRPFVLELPIPRGDGFITIDYLVLNSNWVQTLYKLIKSKNTPFNTDELTTNLFDSKDLKSLLLNSNLSNEIRISAAMALGKLNDKSAIPALKHAFLHDPDWSVRSSAAEALGELNDKSAVPDLMQAFLHDPDWSVRSSAAEALAELNNKSVVPNLMQAFLHDPIPMVRDSAAKALGKLNDKSAVPALKQALLHNPDSFGRSSAAETLAELNDKSAIPALRQAFLHDPDWNVRSIAAYALGELDDTSAVPALMQALLHNPDSNARSSVANTLGELNDKSAIPALRQALLHDPDWNVRSIAAYALGELDDTSAVPALKQALLHNPDSSVRSSAAEALGKINDKSAAPALKQALLHDSDLNVRIYAAYSLGELDDKSAMPTLKQALFQDSDSSVRSSAAEALGKIAFNDLLRSPTSTYWSHRLTTSKISIYGRDFRYHDFRLGLSNGIVGAIQKGKLDRGETIRELQKLIDPKNHPSPIVEWFVHHTLSQIEEEQ